MLKWTTVDNFIRYENCRNWDVHTFFFTCDHKYALIELCNFFLPRNSTPLVFMHNSAGWKVEIVVIFLPHTLKDVFS